MLSLISTPHQNLTKSFLKNRDPGVYTQKNENLQKM
jgi:hypothetical protein